MVEIPNLSRWRKNTVSRFKLLRERGEYHVVEIQLRKFGGYDPEYYYTNSEYNECFFNFTSLKQAKRAHSELEKVGNWEHGYFCIICDSKLRDFASDYADFVCDNCGETYTRFGKPSKKHI